MILPRSTTCAIAPVALGLLLCAAAASAQSHGASSPADRTAAPAAPVLAGEEKGMALPPDSVTDGSVKLASGRSVAYTATAGLLTVGASDTQDAMLALDGRYLADAAVDLPAKADEQPATARMFYTAYIAKDAAAATRPIVFFYNGGPGASTMYLRMTSLGPVRVDIPDLEHPVGGPYRVANNPESLLDVADLVFIDAPGTGYSRIAGRDAMKSFYGIDQDAGAFDRFIRRFLTKYNRWNSPKFLFGESYGTTRDAVLGRRLQNHGVDLNGIVFLSQILSFDNSADGAGANIGTENGFFLALPSYAATAWFHHKVPGEPAQYDTAQFEARQHEVEQYALGEYASALLAGADLDPARKQAVAAKLESYTGVAASLWVKANLRINGGEFAKYLQDEANITTGRLDTRYEGPVMDPLAGSSDYDPFSGAVESSIEAAMNSYAHETLEFGREMTYKPSADDPGMKWDLNHVVGSGWPGTYTNVSADLTATLKENPRMHVLLMGGYFDLGTLYFAATYEMKHLPVPPSIEKNIEYTFFPTGHMVYVNQDALRKLHDRTAAFIEENEKGQ